MGKEMKVVGLGGSLAKRSMSLACLKIALAGAEEAGAQTELFSVRELQLPMYVPGAKEVPESARRLSEAVYEANGLVWSSPLYQGTVSGSFKNAVDWLQLLSDRKPPFLTDKVVGLISVAGGAHALQAVNTMEFSVRALRGWAVPLVDRSRRPGRSSMKTGALATPTSSDSCATWAVRWYARRGSSPRRATVITLSTASKAASPPAA